MRETQKSRIIKYIEDFGSITPAQAVADLGCYKLGSRISEIIRDNLYPIHKEMVKGQNRFGEPTRYMKYSKEEDYERLD